MCVCVSEVRDVFVCVSMCVCVSVSEVSDVFVCVYVYVYVCE